MTAGLPGLSYLKATWLKSETRSQQATMAGILSLLGQKQLSSAGELSRVGSSCSWSVGTGRACCTLLPWCAQRTHQVLFQKAKAGISPHCCCLPGSEGDVQGPKPLWSCSWRKGKASLCLRAKTRATGGGIRHQPLCGNASVQTSARGTRPWYGQAHFSGYFLCF